jgi:hypothetical protein
MAHLHGYPTISFLLPSPPPQINLNSHVDLVFSPLHSSHARKRLKYAIYETKLDKGKEVANPSKYSKDSFELVSSHLHLKYDYSHVISAIHPKGSN